MGNTERGGVEDDTRGTHVAHAPAVELTPNLTHVRTRYGRHEGELITLRFVLLSFNYSPAPTVFLFSFILKPLQLALYDYVHLDVFDFHLSHLGSELRTSIPFH